MEPSEFREALPANGVDGEEPLKATPSRTELVWRQALPALGFAASELAFQRCILHNPVERSRQISDNQDSSFEVRITAFLLQICFTTLRVVVQGISFVFSYKSCRKATYSIRGPAGAT